MKLGVRLFKNTLSPNNIFENLDNMENSGTTKNSGNKTWIKDNNKKLSTHLRKSIYSKLFQYFFSVIDFFLDLIESSILDQ